jgi:transposase
VDFLVTSGNLKQGDYLIMDNAAVHLSSDTIDPVLAQLQTAGVRILLASTYLNQVHPIFLPAYSPELNPCEHVFSVVKRYLRNNPDVDKSLRLRVVKALTQVTHEKVEQFYHHCIHNVGGLISPTQTPVVNAV